MQNTPNRANDDGTYEHEVRLARRVYYIRFCKGRRMRYEQEEGGREEIGPRMGIRRGGRVRSGEEDVREGLAEEQL